jgi:hypothetical protein
MHALYVGISIAAFVAILVHLVLNRGKTHRISTPTMLGMTMIVVGIILGESWWISYSLIGVGVVLAAIDAKWAKSHEQR